MLHISEERNIPSQGTLNFLSAGHISHGSCGVEVELDLEFMHSSEICVESDILLYGEFLLLADIEHEGTCIPNEGWVYFA